MTNHTDKELLRLSAFAADISVGWNEKFNKFEKLTPEGWIGVFFDPLTDDGDALRLAVKMKFDVMTRWGEPNSAILDREGNFTIQADVDLDMYAATRRAIVRAAAAIGEKL